MVTDKDIVVQGRKVETIAAIMDTDEQILPGLKAELDHQADRSKDDDVEKNPQGREITIMGDKRIPYKLLKKIMITCVSSSYTNISLAVLQKTKDQV